MATHIHNISVFSQGNIVVSPTVIQLNRYRVLTDIELTPPRLNRNRMPMVWIFLSLPVTLTKYWQWYLCAINYGMLRKHIAALLDYKKAFANGTGLGDPGDPRQNWITNENLKAPKLPQFDKVRTCGDAVVEMVEGVVTMLDGTKPPPLKPGYAQPRTINEASPEIYLYTPQNTPELFFACVNSVDGEPRPFPNGATYSWYKNGLTPVTFLPHVSPLQVTYPPVKITDNTPTLVKI